MEEVDTLTLNCCFDSFTRLPSKNSFFLFNGLLKKFDWQRKEGSGLRQLSVNEMNFSNTATIQFCGGGAQRHISSFLSSSISLTTQIFVERTASPQLLPSTVRPFSRVTKYVINVLVKTTKCCAAGQIMYYILLLPLPTTPLTFLVELVPLKCSLELPFKDVTLWGKVQI